MTFSLEIFSMDTVRLAARTGEDLDAIYCDSELWFSGWDHDASEGSAPDVTGQAP
jgi:hypothetical protein